MMEYVFSKTESAHTLARVTVSRGKVTSATPSFAWAVGGGLHLVLSWAARKGITWRRRAVPVGQAELRF
jgi:hypothetical protein